MKNNKNRTHKFTDKGINLDHVSLIRTFKSDSELFDYIEKKIESYEYKIEKGQRPSVFFLMEKNSGHIFFADDLNKIQLYIETVCFEEQKISLEFILQEFDSFQTAMNLSMENLYKHPLGVHFPKEPIGALLEDVIKYIEDMNENKILGRGELVMRIQSIKGLVDKYEERMIVQYDANELNEIKQELIEAVSELH